MKILQQIIALAVFLAIACALIYVGVYVMFVVLLVGAAAAVWFGVKFYFIRREIEKAMREHKTGGYTRTEETDSTIIEGEFTEVDDGEKK